MLACVTPSVFAMFCCVTFCWDRNSARDNASSIAFFSSAMRSRRTGFALTFAASSANGLALVMKVILPPLTPPDDRHKVHQRSEHTPDTMHPRDSSCRHQGAGSPFALGRKRTRCGDFLLVAAVPSCWGNLIP